MEGSRVDDPDSVFDGMRRKNGWQMSGLPWTYDLDPDRMALPEREAETSTPATPRTDDGGRRCGLEHHRLRLPREGQRAEALPTRHDGGRAKRARGVLPLAGDGRAGILHGPSKGCGGAGPASGVRG